MILYTILLSVFVLYVSFIWVKYGVQESISASYYCLPNNQKALFTLFCWGFSIPAIVLGSTGFMFFAGAGICFVGAAAEFKSMMTREVHFIAAGLGVFFSQLSIGIDFGLWPINLISLSMMAIIVFFKFKNKIWWAEIVAFAAICVALAISIL